MGDGLSIDTGATDRVAAGLADAATRLADPADLLADIGSRVLTDATARAPRATGALAGSGAVAPGQLEGHPAALLTWGVRYALFVNFGTSRMPARPFATDALAAAAADADTLARTWAKHLLDGVT